MRLSGSPRSPTPLTPLPAPQERKAWWPRLRDYMGKDIMSLMSVPVFIMARDKAPVYWPPLTAAPPPRRAAHARGWAPCDGLARLCAGAVWLVVETAAGTGATRLRTRVHI